MSNDYNHPNRFNHVPQTKPYYTPNPKNPGPPPRGKTLGGKEHAVITKTPTFVATDGFKVETGKPGKAQVVKQRFVVDSQNDPLLWIVIVLLIIIIILLALLLWRAWDPYCGCFQGLQSNQQTIIKTSSRDEFEKNLLELSKEQPNLSIFVELLEKVNLDELLTEEGPYTVFAPDNDTLQSLPDGQLERFRNDPQATDELTQFLKQFIVAGDLTTEELQNYSSSSISTTGFIKRFGSIKVVAQNSSNPTSKIEDKNISVDDEGNITIDEGLIRNRDLKASNGILHIINRTIDDLEGVDSQIEADLAGIYKGNSILGDSDLDFPESILDIREDGKMFLDSDDLDLSKFNDPELQVDNQYPEMESRIEGTLTKNDQGEYIFNPESRELRFRVGDVLVDDEIAQQLLEKIRNKGIELPSESQSIKLDIDKNQDSITIKNLENEEIFIFNGGLLNNQSNQSSTSSSLSSRSSENQTSSTSSSKSTNASGSASSAENPVIRSGGR